MHERAATTSRQQPTNLQGTGHPKGRLCDRPDLPDALKYGKKHFKLPHPPSYYKALEDTLKPAPGYTWADVELDRTLRSYKQYYHLPEFRRRPKHKVTPKVYNTWDEFKAHLEKTKPKLLPDANKLFVDIGYISGLFTNLYLV